MLYKFIESKILAKFISESGTILYGTDQTP